MSAMKETRENLGVQISELEALQSVYPKELTIVDHGNLADINEYISNCRDDLPQRLEYSIQVTIPEVVNFSRIFILSSRLLISLIPILSLFRRLSKKIYHTGIITSNFQDFIMYMTKFRVGFTNSRVLVSGCTQKTDYILPLPRLLV